MPNRKQLMRDVEWKLLLACRIIRKYDWLINAYVADFYLKDHWSLIPWSWQHAFAQLKLEHLGDLLEVNRTNDNKGCVCVWPLTLLALRRLFQMLCVERQYPYKQQIRDNTLLQHPKLKHAFNKGVKSKKRHELENMAKVCHTNYLTVPVDFIVDFGAGLGHLARILGYVYGVKVCCLEQQSRLNRKAIELDKQIELLIGKYLTKEEAQLCQKPIHIDLCLNKAMEPYQFLQIIRQALHLTEENFSFGIIGLHPCGDLAVILMRMFLNCKQAKFLNIVGCCYMKLSNDDINFNNNNCSYPLSNFLRGQYKLSFLSYEAKEISCHAIEQYKERLQMKDYNYLKVHSYRAAAERIIVKYFPHLAHWGLRNVKQTIHMDFTEYFYKAVADIPAYKLPINTLTTQTTSTDLEQWQRIAIFYTLRLFFAPLVENIILLDRMLYLMENDCKVEIITAFDPLISSRNHIIKAIKFS